MKLAPENNTSSVTQESFPTENAESKEQPKTAEAIVTTSNGKYPILGESGRGGKIINGKLIEY